MKNGRCYFYVEKQIHRMPSSVDSDITLIPLFLSSERIWHRFGINEENVQ